MTADVDSPIWQFEGRCELALVKKPKDLSEKTYGFSGHL